MLGIHKIMETQHKIIYYLVNDLYIYCSKNYVAYSYVCEKWVACDYTRCISDYLYGFDETEPVDSPYRFGNSAISRQIKELSEDDIIKRIGKKAILDVLTLFEQEV